MNSAFDLHNDAFVCDMTFPWSNFGRRDLAIASLQRMHSNGMNFVSLTVGMDWDDTASAMLNIAKERNFLRNNQDSYVLVETIEDIYRAKTEDKLAIGLHFQGTNPLGYNVELVEAYYRLGIRHMLLCYNLKNPVGDGCQEITDSGLSRFGYDVIREMNSVGMLVDVSHTGYRTSMDALEASEKPVIISHSNPSGLFEHSRNVPDDMILACAKTGGVVGMVGFASVVSEEKELKTEGLVNHIEYCIDLVGDQHVGLGLDYVYDQEFDSRSVWSPHYSGRPISVFEPEQLPILTEVLLKRGYAETTVRGILGENWIRVAGEVWK